MINTNRTGNPVSDPEPESKLYYGSGHNFRLLAAPVPQTAIYIMETIF